MRSRVIGVWLIGLLLMQAAWIVVVPPFRGSDEVDHVFRAAAVADGEWFVDEWASDGRGLYVTVSSDIVRDAQFQCERQGYPGRDNCSGTKSDEPGHVRVSSGAGLYHPLFYWIVGTAAQPFDGFNAVYAMRIASSALCLLLLWAAAWAAGRSASRWPLAALTVALTPVAIYSTTLPAPNGPEMAAAAALWTSLAAMLQERRVSRRLLAIAVVAAVILCTLRLLGPLFVLMIVATVLLSSPRGVRTLIAHHRGRILAGVIAVGVAAISAGAWILGAGLQNGTPQEKLPGSIDLERVIVWNLQTIAAFPLRNDEGAAIAYPIFLGVAVAIVVLGLRGGSHGERSAIVAGIVISLGLPIVLTLLTAAGHGVVWQGRYLLPYGMGVIILCGYVLDRTRTDARGWRLVGPVAAGMGIAVTACLLKIKDDELRIGVEPAWMVPPDLLIVLLVGLASCAFAVAVAGTPRRASRRRAGVDVVEPARPGRR